MRQETRWILVSTAEADLMMRPFADHLHRRIEAMGVGCDHIDTGEGLREEDPMLLTDDGRYDGPAAIEAFLRSGCAHRPAVPRNRQHLEPRRISVRLPGRTIPVMIRYGENPYLATVFAA